jgi:hypothetical protein
VTRGLESMKRILSSLLSKENLELYCNPESFSAETFDEFKFMSILGNVNVVIEQFRKLFESECPLICEFYCIQGFEPLFTFYRWLVKVTQCIESLPVK